MYNVYAVKAPLLAYNSFVEAIFILNACLLILRAHESAIEMQIYNKCVSGGNDENLRYKRMHIYVSLLKQMAPENLLSTFAKLCRVSCCSI